jgi:hypothetical protein
MGPTFRPVTPCHSPKWAQIETQHALQLAMQMRSRLLVKAPTRHPARSMCGSALVLRVPAEQLTHILNFTWLCTSTQYGWATTAGPRACSDYGNAMTVGQCPNSGHRPSRHGLSSLLLCAVVLRASTHLFRLPGVFYAHPSSTSRA